jgi:choline dehydrogenase
MVHLTSSVVSVLLAAGTAAAYPSSISYANILERSEQVADTYDYVIVGGGTAGLTAGDRLSESGKCMIWHDLT